MILNPVGVCEIKIEDQKPFIPDAILAIGHYEAHIDFSDKLEIISTYDCAILGYTVDGESCFSAWEVGEWCPRTDGNPRFHVRNQKKNLTSPQ